MNKSPAIKILAAIIIVCIIGSYRQHTRHVEPAFYYWKSQFQLSGFERLRLDSLQVSTLYVKLFDVVWDELAQRASPVAKLVVRDTGFLKNINIIPTVFITNEVFYKLDSTAIRVLARNITSLIKKYQQLYRLTTFKEVQMDCDWTTTTRRKYFYFLEEIKREYSEPELSATIRLHQVKYTGSAGIPPVQKGLLMCYNMGTLQQSDAVNSIISVKEFQQYAGAIDTYPLPLDIGLPLFDWYVLFRDNKYAGLFMSIKPSLLSRFRQTDKNLFEVIEDTLVDGRRLKVGDRLRYENSNIETVQAVASLLNKKLKASRLRVVLYHCDSVTLSKYPSHELESIYRSMQHY